MARLSNVVGLVLTGEKMEQIVADMQKKEPDCEFKLYSWDGDLIASILPIMLEANAFEEINWNWDNDYEISLFVQSFNFTCVFHDIYNLV